jgi:hypothetical protein
MFGAKCDKMRDMLFMGGLNDMQIYSTSQKFGHTYLFKGFSHCRNNSEDIKTMK